MGLDRQTPQDTPRARFASPTPFPLKGIFVGRGASPESEAGGICYGRRERGDERVEQREARHIGTSYCAPPSPKTTLPKENTWDFRGTGGRRIATLSCASTGGTPYCRTVPPAEGLLAQPYSPSGLHDPRSWRLLVFPR